MDVPLDSDARERQRRAMAAFLKGLADLVLEESSAQRHRLLQQWSKPVAQRVALGRAVENVTVAGMGKGGRLILHCTRNDSRFREGDLLRLNRGDPAAAPHWQVSLEQDEDTELEVSAEGMMGLPTDVFLREPEGWVLDEDFLDLSQYTLDALDQVGDTAVGRTQILPLLMGRREPKVDGARYQRGLDLAAAWGLNWNQGEALAQAYASDLVHLIQGPPGTGKTRVLAYLAQALVEEGERVFVTAFTHRAINNALNMIARRAPDVPVAKIGQSSRADDLTVANHEQFVTSPMAEMAGGYVLGATPFATRTSRLQGVEFDTVIFDEASQITLPLAIMGMLAAKRFVFIGDHRQLPPVLTTRYSAGVFRESVFGALVDRGFDTMLDETYRLNAELTDWPSRQFYEGRLVSVPDVAGRRMVYPLPPQRLAAILDPAQPKVFVDLGHRNITTQCRQEASLAVDLIAELLACGVAPGEIGVVAPYRAQGRAIRNLLRQAVPDPRIRRALVVDTVERMQGQERDVVLVSLTTSNPGFAADLAEFFFQPERLNVAITRPRSKLIILGSRHVLRAQPPEPELQAAVAMLADLLGTCSYHSAGGGG